MVLDQLEAPRLGDAVREAISASLRSGVTTPDLGGSATTEEVGEWIADQLGTNSTTESADA
jgi:isocitrate/isopropylmalate dehydrogenase